MKFKFVRNYKRTAFRGVLSLLAGAVAVFVPGLTMKTVIMGIGTLIMIGGLVSLAILLAQKRKEGQGWFASQALFNILMGVICISMPEMLVKVFVVLLGLALFFIGFMQLVAGMSIRKVATWAWLYYAFAAGIMLSGAVMLGNPFESAEAILTFMGVILMLFGLGELYLAWRVSRQPQVVNGQEVEDATYEEL